MTTDRDAAASAALDRVAARARGGKPAEVARIVIAGTSGIVAFGLVGFFGLTDRQATPEPAPATAVTTTPGPSIPTTLAPAPVAGATVATNAVPLTTILGEQPPAPAAPAPAPTAPIVAAPPPPVDIVSEQSR